MQTLESKKKTDYLHMQLSDYEHLYKGASYIDGKLVLRKLSDMTEEERAQKDRLKNMEDNYTSAWEPLMNRAESIKYLLSKHFDLFGLIPAGLAIDKNQKQ